MSNHIKITPAPGTWVVRAGGAVLGESQHALELREGRYDPVIYFPRDDLAMAMFEASASRTHCPRKGDASYFSIQTKSTLIEDAAWSYEAPLDAVSAIKNHLAFYSDKVTLEEL